MSFVKKVILITGGGSGIGAATAVFFARLGAQLSLVDLNGETLQETIITCKSVADEHGFISNIPPLAVVADLTKDAKRIIDETIKTFGKLDVLVNNAGIFLNHDSIESDKIMENYESIMNINLKSVIQLTSLAVPYLIETKGNIVNVGSVAGMTAVSSCLIYALSKAAINQFTKCVALELARKGVRVNAVNPGAISTNLYTNSGLGNELFQTMLTNYSLLNPIERYGHPDEIARAIAFFASDESGFITGTLLAVDGGRVIATPKLNWNK